MFNVKKFLSIFLILLLFFSFTACKQDAPKLKCLDILVSLSEISQEDNFDIWACYGDEIYDDSFSSMYGITYDMISDGGILYCSEGGVSDEVSIFYIKDRNDISLATQKLDDRIKQRRKVFEGYLPEEVYKIDEARIMVCGNYVALIISNDSIFTEAELRNIISEGGK